MLQCQLDEVEHLIVLSGVVFTKRGNVLEKRGY